MILKKHAKDPHEKHHKQKPREQPAQVPYKLASYEHDHEGKRFKSSNVAFSFWSASKYVLVLSLMLWWLPFFGQMIAGYVGGRRAGGPWKGVTAAILPVVLLYIVVTGFESGVLPSHIFGMAVAPSAVGASLGHTIPIIAPYIEFSTKYVGDFMSALEGSSPYGINPYVLTVAFAYVGGVIAEQHRRELEFASGSVVSSTTVLVHDSAHQRAAVEMQPQVQNDNPGVLAALGAHMHWPWHHRQDEVNAYFPRHHRDEWARAVNMRYVEDDVDEVSGRGYADDAQYSRRESRRRQRRLARPSADYDEGEASWKQKRRGRPNLSAKPRFAYPKYADESLSGGYGDRSFRRPKPQPRLTVGQEPRSIRRARKFMDRDWSGRQIRDFDYSHFSSSDEAERVEPEVGSHHKRQHNHHDWDTI